MSFFRLGEGIRNRRLYPSVFSTLGVDGVEEGGVH